MELTVLVDNNTMCQLNAEWGLSFYIETHEIKLLFDFGKSNLFIVNAAKLGVNLSEVTHSVLSHGHFDHSHGLKYLLSDSSNFIGILYAHPNAFKQKLSRQKRVTGIDIDLDTVLKTNRVQVVLEKAPVHISDQLIFLGEIERSNSFEPIVSSDGYRKNGNQYVLDQMCDDTAIVYKTDLGIIVIVGCSHSGICNTIEYAKKVAGDDRVIDVIGGFHIFDKDTKNFEDTMAYFKQSGVKRIHPSHCTSFEAIVELSRVVNVGSMGVGKTIKY